MKKIWQGIKGEEGAEDKQVHDQFVRFGKGVYENRAVLRMQRSTKIKLKGSFEWVNDFVVLVSELNENVRFSGVILNKEEIAELSEFPKKKKSGLVQYDVQDMESRQVREIEEKVYAMLLDVETADNTLSLKIKKKLPKPGKSSGGKVDDKFCQLEAELRHWPIIKEAFMLPECKKAKVSHIYNIGEIILPEMGGEGEEREEKTQEKDFAKIREMAKRKGRIIRKMEVDKQERREEKEFEV